MGLVPNPELGPIRSYIYNRQASEHQFFPEEYFSGSDVAIYFGDVWIDEITSLQFMMQENVRPIYGYASYTWDFFARGNRIIEGEFRIAFKEAGYLNSIFKHLESLKENAKPRLSFLLDDLSTGVPNWIAGIKDNIEDLLWRYKGPKDQYMNPFVVDPEVPNITNAGTQSGMVKDNTAAPGTGPATGTDSPGGSSTGINISGKRYNSGNTQTRKIIGYNIYKKEIEGYMPFGYTDKEEFLFQNLSPATRYVFGIEAVDSLGNKSEIKNVDIKTLPLGSGNTTPPNTPSGLAGKMITDNEIALVWNNISDPAGNEKDGKYEIYYKKKNDTVFTKIEVSDLNNKYRIINNLYPNTEYNIYIRVKSSTNIYSNPSGTITVKTLKENEDEVSTNKVSTKGFNINYKINNSNNKFIVGFTLKTSDSSDITENSGEREVIELINKKDNRFYFYTFKINYKDSATSTQIKSSNWSNIIAIKNIDNIGIVPPKNLRETARSEKTIKLEWDNGSGGGGVKRYELYLDNIISDGSDIDLGDSTSNKFVINLQDELDFKNTYKRAFVRAIYANGSSADSEIVNISFEKKYENIPKEPAISVDNNQVYSNSAIIGLNVPVLNFGITSYNLYIYEVDNSEKSSYYGLVNYKVNKDNISLRQDNHYILIQRNIEKDKTNKNLSLKSNTKYRIFARSVSNYFGDSDKKFAGNYDKYLSTESISSNYIEFTTKNIPNSIVVNELSLVEERRASGNIKFRLKWKDNAAIDPTYKYKIYINNYMVKEVVKSSLTSASGFFEQEVEATLGINELYNIYIRVESGVIEYSEGNIITYITNYISNTDNTSPSPPLNLIIDGHTHNSVKLKWDKSTGDNPVFYNIYLGEGKYVEGNSKPMLYGVLEGENKNNCTIGTLNPYKEYYFFVTSSDIYGNESIKSNVKVQRTKPRPDDPTLRIKPYSIEKIQLISGGNRKVNSILLKWKRPEILVGKDYDEYEVLTIGGHKIRKYDWDIKKGNEKSYVSKLTSRGKLAGSRVHQTDYVVEQLKKRLEELGYDFPKQKNDIEIYSPKPKYEYRDNKKNRSTKARNESKAKGNWYCYKRYINIKGKKTVKFKSGEDIKSIDTPHFTDKWLQSRLLTILSKIQTQGRIIINNDGTKKKNELSTTGKEWKKILEIWPKDKKTKKPIIDGKYGDETQKALQLFLKIANIKDGSNGAYLSDKAFNALNSSIFNDTNKNEYGLDNKGFNMSTMIAVKIFQANWGTTSDGRVGPSTLNGLERATGIRGNNTGDNKTTESKKRDKNNNGTAGSIPSLNGAVSTAKDLVRGTGNLKSTGETLMAQQENITWNRKKIDAGYNKPYFYRNTESENLKYMADNGFDIYILYGPLAEYLIRGDGTIASNNNQIMNTLPQSLKSGVNFNHTIRAIRNVQIYSIGTIVDASGNPIEEVYRFMAKDID